MFPPGVALLKRALVDVYLKLVNRLLLYPTAAMVTQDVCFVLS